MQGGSSELLDWDQLSAHKKGTLAMKQLCPSKGLNKSKAKADVDKASPPSMGIACRKGSIRWVMAVEDT